MAIRAIMEPTGTPVEKAISLRAEIGMGRESGAEADPALRLPRQDLKLRRLDTKKDADPGEDQRP